MYLWSVYCIKAEISSFEEIKLAGELGMENQPNSLA